MKQIVAKPFTEEIHKKFKAVCLDKDVSISEAIRLFVSETIATAGSNIVTIRQGESVDQETIILKSK